ncbi:2OG-Fe dioxygenase family protein [Marinomonas mediterranea]|uniref:2OG-Fe dioxygenase family protein n=1 Tax=Marinomonas mediterranea TaxID=119864 RepID=UPI00234B2235|nr:2OG-Fe dioxygenase family protein [Marinomonas mediterranea]WCN10301.1 hypothetical protein GV055_15950 [Marinomonas mediterranea]
MKKTTHTTEPFYLELGQLTRQCVNHLSPSFDRLPNNPYADGSYRIRRYSRFCFLQGHLEHLPTHPFVQDESINHFQGNVVRRYEELEGVVIEDPMFLEMFEHFKHMSGVEYGTHIEVHQLRIFADHQKAEVSPEGIHQDGFDRIGIYVIQRHNIEGGSINVHLSENSPAFISHAFDHGEFVILNDKKFFHSAKAIEPSDGDLGYMDVFVLTANLYH